MCSAQLLLSGCCSAHAPVFTSCPSPFPHSRPLPPRRPQLLTDAGGRLVELGEGAMAVVYLGRLQGLEVAVKVFELEPGLDSGAVWREVSMLRHCIHPRVVPLFGVTVQARACLRGRGA